MFSPTGVDGRLNNTNPALYPGPGAIRANIPNADCSELINAAQVSAIPVGTGYTVLLADMADETKVCYTPFLSLLRFLTPPRITDLCHLPAL